MKKTSIKVIKTTSIIALLLSLIVAILVPLGYFVIAYEYQAAVLTTEVAAQALQASQIISSNPDYWRFEQHRLEEFLSRRSRSEHREIRRITDINGSVIAHSGDAAQNPLMTRSHDLFDSGKAVARMEISRSLRPLLIKTFLVLVVGLLLGVGMLVFLRKVPLAALAQAMQSLQQSEGKFRAIASTAADAIIVMDNHGIITYFNAAAEKMFGYSWQEALGKELHQLIAPERYRDAYKNGFEKFRESGRGPAIGNTLEFRAVRKDGTEFPIEVSTSVIPVSDEWHAVGIVRDISERKRTERELLKLEKLESLGVLAGGLAHDFNNLLTIMMGNISLAMLDTDVASSNYSRLANLGEAAVRAQNLTRQLLTFAKGGAPVKKTVCVREIIEESCRFSLSGSNVNCNFSFAEDLKPAEVDPGQIGQVIHNLILNAVQAMPQGGSVDVGCQNISVTPNDGLPVVPGNYVKISVRDAGIGIPKENLSKIFDPYFTTKAKGSGLGLATSYSIVNRHGGAITVDSIPGSGPVFHLYLPASDNKPEAAEFREQSAARGKGRILIMDDEHAYRMVLGDILKTIGYEYELARDGTEAIEFYKNAMAAGRPFDTVIMDLTIPGGMGGKEAIKKLLEMDPKVKAIVASGYSSDPVMADFKAYGFMGMIEKPFDLRTLSAALQAVLSG
jgi:PAS domain S-box-containing protein